MARKPTRKKPGAGPASRAKAPAKAKVRSKPTKPRKHARAPAPHATRTAPAAEPQTAPAPATKQTALDANSLRELREMLLRLRERLTGQISVHADDSLKQVDDTSTEDRTDDFDREFALNLVSSEHDALFEIDSALRRIKEGTYGTCESCGCAIEKARLKALPFAHLCVRCQSSTEKGRARFRPFGEALSQVAEHAESEEADETEDAG